MTDFSAFPYALIALDLDGTLTNSEKLITPRTFDALMTAQRAGVRLVLASGRPTRGIAPLAEQLQLANYGGFVLSYNGGRIIEWATKRALYSQTVSPALIPQLFAFAEQAQLPIVTYLPNEILASRIGDAYLEEESKINAMPVVVAKDFVQEANKLEGGATKFLIPGDPDKLVELEVQMKSSLSSQMEVFRSAPYFLELTPKGIDKAQSLQRLLEHLDLQRESLVAFGDGYNDLSMLEFAGTGIAMANAAEEVKAISNMVTTSNDEDGIALALEKLCLQ